MKIPSRNIQQQTHRVYNKMQRVNRTSVHSFFTPNTFPNPLSIHNTRRVFVKFPIVPTIFSIHETWKMKYHSANSTTMVTKSKKKYNSTNRTWCMSMRVIGKNLVIIGTRYCKDVSNSLCDKLGVFTKVERKT